MKKLKSKVSEGWLEVYPISNLWVTEKSVDLLQMPPKNLWGLYCECLETIKELIEKEKINFAKIKIPRQYCLENYRKAKMFFTNLTIWRLCLEEMGIKYKESLSYR